MNEETLKLITASLPAMQVDALKVELAKAERLPKAEELIKALQDEKLKLNEEIRQMQSNIALRDSYEKRSKELDKREVDLKILEATIKYDSEVRVSTNLKELMYAAFRNPTIHKSFSKIIGVPSGGYTSSVTESETETKD